MFLVLNKDKIQTYIVSVLTVAVLIVVANIGNVKTISTSATTKLLPIYHVQTEEKKIAFTMNCAWNADDIDSILETLKNNNVHITFFMVGNWVDKYPEAVKKIYEAGHEIGSHSNTHPHVNNLSAEKNLEEIKLGVSKISKITGKEINLYRAPYGEYNDTVIQTAQENGYYTIQWSVDSLDWKDYGREEIIDAVVNHKEMRNGAIILCHNGAKYTAEALDEMITALKDLGYDFVPISELIYKDNYHMDVTGRQIKEDGI